MGKLLVACVVAWLLLKKISCSNFSKYWPCVFPFITSIEVGQIFGKRPSIGLIPDLPPIHPNSPRPGHLSAGQQPRRTSTQSTGVPGNSVPSSPILGNRARGFSPARDQRLFIASFCRLDDMNWDPSEPSLHSGTIFARPARTFQNLESRLDGWRAELA